MSGCGGTSYNHGRSASVAHVNPSQAPPLRWQLEWVPQCMHASVQHNGHGVLVGGSVRRVFRFVHCADASTIGTREPSLRTNGTLSSRVY